MSVQGPPRPRPTRVVVFVDVQNLYNRCKDRFGWPWIHPVRLGKALVAEDLATHGTGSHCLAGVRYYTGIHDANRRPDHHGKMQRRLQAYEADGASTFWIPLRYDGNGKAREKGVDVRIALDLLRLGQKGLYDVAIVVSEDSDLNEAVSDVIALRDSERWIAVENALPWTTDRLRPRWLTAAPRKRRITPEIFAQVRDNNTY